MATSDSENQFNYDVFLSFRGPDTRKGFTDHLYRALKNGGVKTFRDDDEIERCENITSELVKAIKGSKMSVIIFSENYTSSKACLQEVETIFKHNKTSKQQQQQHHHDILPIFYNVEPAEVKKKARELDPNQQQWSEALKEVASLAGMPLKDQYEGEFVDEIVEMVKSKLIPKLVTVGRQLIGMESKVKKINLWLRDRNDNVGILVLCGMGGVGKTTTSDYVFKSNRERFDASSFIGSVREASKINNGYVRLQRQLLQDLQRKPEKKIYTVDDGHRRIQFVLTNKRVLLVLDDVDHEDQLDSILNMRNWCAPRTKVIITTRRQDLLKAHENYKIHRLETLDEEESLQLFSLHAFGQICPAPGFLDYSKKFVSHCQGLPLALEVLGSSVSRKNVEVWDIALAQLEVIPNTKILEKLKISYDSLNNNKEKNLFLDIACFFVGKDKNDAISILDGCYYYTALVIQNLVDRNLLSVGEKDNKLRMHQLIQDMGKQVISEESNSISDHSRLWRDTESLNILTDKNGSAKTEGLVLDMKMLKESNNPTDAEVHHSHLRLFYNWMYPNRKTPNSLETDAFREMINIRILKLCYVQLLGSYDVFPKRLVWLCLRGFHLKSLPSEFPLDKIVSLDLRNNNLKQVWNENKVFKSLKILNLSHSHELSRTPNFFTVPNLEKLILKDCPCLIEIDESIASLRRLISLNLKNCKNLRMLPRNISTVNSLEILDISGCLNLVGVAEELEKMEYLKVLHMDRLEVNQVLSRVPPRNKFMLPWLEKQIKISKISWGSLPKSLVVLSLIDNNLTNDSFPEDFGSLPMLQDLNLGGNQFCRLPDFVRKLGRLQKLNLSWCPRLEQIEWPPIHNKELIVTECRALQQITCETYIGPGSVSHGACMSLNYVERGFKIESMENVDPSVLQNIGFFEFEIKKKAKVFIVNGIVWSRLNLPVQVIYEAYTFSSYLPGKEVPSYFNKRNPGSKISFTVPASTSSLGFRGMNMCMVYKFPIDMEEWPPAPISVKFYNKSNGLDHEYTPRCHGRNSDADDEDLIWVTHWFHQIWGSLFREGDEVEVWFSIYAGGEIKECGVNFLYNEQGRMAEYYNTLFSSWDSRMNIFYPILTRLDDGDLSVNRRSNVVIQFLDECDVPIDGVDNSEEENNDHEVHSDSHDRGGREEGEQQQEEERKREKRIIVVV